MNEAQLIQAELDQKQELADRARDGNLLAFTLYTKPDYFINWHHQYLCRILNKFIKGEIKRLMIFMPPRHGKTELVSRRLPALLHGLYPNDEIMAATYSAELAADMCTDIQRIMDTNEYHELFPNSRITPENSVSRYARNRVEHELIPIEGKMGMKTIFQGTYRAQGIGGGFSGLGADWLLMDDPIKNREDADSKPARDTVWKFWTSTFRSRLEGDGAILVTTTRWHADDLAGRLLRQARSNPEADQWTVVRLPALRDNLDDPNDPREIGEPLWETKFPLRLLLSAKASSSRDWSALYQQSPVAEGGTLFKEKDFRYYKVKPERFDQIIQSWDMATKEKTLSDYYVGQVWGRLGVDKYLLHQVRGQWPFPTACKKLVEVTRTFPTAYKKLIEAKANGPAVMQTLQATVSGMVEVEPRGDKVARANSVLPEFEGGNVYFPHETIAPWINEYITELMEFPNGANDDQVDATTQAVDCLRSAQPLYMPSAGHGSGTVY